MPHLKMPRFQTGNRLQLPLSKLYTFRIIAGKALTNNFPKNDDSTLSHMGSGMTIPPIV